MQSASVSPFLRIGTRGSPLALAQAREVRRRLAAAHGVADADIAIETIVTSGDQSQKTNRPLSDFGGKGLFSKEIEERLQAGSIDIAVHSSKDMATTLPDGLVMPVFLEREDVRDVLISQRAGSLESLPGGAILGTSSIRRRAQIARLRPDLKLIEFRGNVGTRLKKLEDGVADATIMAAAGLLRLGNADRVTAFLDPRVFPPAPAQGAIGIELRANDDRAYNLVLPLNHAETAEAITAERAFLAELDGSCRTPIAALTTRTGADLSLFGQILSPDGKEAFEAEIAGPASDAVHIGKALGQRLREAAGIAFFEALEARY